MSNEWEDLARSAADRRERLKSFGPHAVGVLVESEAGRFVVDPEDNSVSAALLHHGDYAREEVELVRTFLRGGDILVVGSHIGAHVVALSRHAPALVVIEANPHTFKFLTANISLNGCDNVQAHNVAAGESDGRIQFVLNRENSGGSKRMPNTRHLHYFYDDPDVVDVEMAALDTLIGPRSFDLILMDIEGSEYFALKGMPNLLANAGALAVEFLGHHLVDVAGVTPEQFAEPLLEHFSWLYLPRHRQVVPRGMIVAKIREMYDQGDGHDLIIFTKDLPGRLGVPENAFTVLRP
jgi:FkbM family methyltransferase